MANRINTSKNKTRPKSGKRKAQDVETTKKLRELSK